MMARLPVPRGIGPGVLGLQAPQFLEELPLPVAGLARRHDADDAVLVAARLAVRPRDALAPEAQAHAGGRPRRDADGGPAGDRRHVDGPAEGGLAHGDRNIHINIIALAAEGTGAAARAGPGTGRPAGRRPARRPARRVAAAGRPRRPAECGPPAAAAGGSPSAAGRCSVIAVRTPWAACSNDTSSADSTSCAPPRGRAPPAAPRPPCIPAICARISSKRLPAPSAPPPNASNETSSNGDPSPDHVYRRPRPGPSPPGACPRRRPGPEALRPELVVQPPLLGVAQGLVRLAHFLELLLGLLVAGVQVGVILARQAAVRRADLVLACALRHAQHLVVICVGHGPSPLRGIDLVPIIENPIRATGEPQRFAERSGDQALL